MGTRRLIGKWLPIEEIGVGEDAGPSAADFEDLKKLLRLTLITG